MYHTDQIRVHRVRLWLYGVFQCDGMIHTFSILLFSSQQRVRVMSGGGTERGEIGVAILLRQCSVQT